MDEHSRIDHFTVGINLDVINLGKGAVIGRGNWITGFPSNTVSRHFSHQPDRCSKLLMGDYASITKNHHIDCTNLVTIGRFATIAGYQSQFLTHSIDILESRQSSAPIFIGDYCFVGTRVIILGGGTLPEYSVLAAGSLLKKVYVERYVIYGGTPAKAIGSLSKDAKYFYRNDRYIW